jgi:hypothetical protein
MRRAAGLGHKRGYGNIHRKIILIITDAVCLFKLMLKSNKLLLIFPYPFSTLCCLICYFYYFFIINRHFSVTHVLKFFRLLF